MRPRAGARDAHVFEICDKKASLSLVSDAGDQSLHLGLGGNGMRLIKNLLLLYGRHSVKARERFFILQERHAKAHG